MNQDKPTGGDQPKGGDKPTEGAKPEPMNDEYRGTYKGDPIEGNLELSSGDQGKTKLKLTRKDKGQPKNLLEWDEVTHADTKDDPAPTTKGKGKDATYTPGLSKTRISNDKNRNWVEIWCPTTQDPKKQQNPGDGTLIIHIDGSPDDQIKISHDLQMKLLQDIKKQNLKPTPKK